MTIRILNAAGILVDRAGPINDPRLMRRLLLKRNDFRSRLRIEFINLYSKQGVRIFYFIPKSEFSRIIFDLLAGLCDRLQNMRIVVLCKNDEELSRLRPQHERPEIEYINLAEEQCGHPNTYMIDRCSHLVYIGFRINMLGACGKAVRYAKSRGCKVRILELHDYFLEED